MTEAQAELLNMTMSRASDNTWIAILLSLLTILLFGLYILSRVYFIIEIQKRSTSRFMAFVDDILDGIDSVSSKRALNLLPTYLNPGCSECVHPKDSYHGTLSVTLHYGTRNRIKQRWHENGFLKLDKCKEDFEHEVEILGKRLRTKSQLDMELRSNGLKEFISKTHEERFTEKNSIKAITKIMNEGIRIKKQERKDMMKALLFWRSH